jgi:DNA-binding MarR family transcriptional regulator
VTVVDLDLAAVKAARGACRRSGTTACSTALMAEPNDPLAAALFSEIFMADQLARNRLSKVLPKGMELSHFSVLNHLARLNAERTPAQLARAFHVTRGAMTNTLGRLEWAGHVHIRPDWDDARRKWVAISPSGRAACDAALAAIAPILVARW